MNFFEEVSVEQLANLEVVSTKHPTVIKTDDSYENTGIDTRTYYECNACGWCGTPGKCVSSIECPECASASSELCRDPEAGNRFVAYHEERWLEVKEMFGTYYK